MPTSPASMSPMSELASHQIHSRFGDRLECQRRFEHRSVSCVVVCVIQFQFSRDNCVPRNRAVIRIVASIVHDGVSRRFMPPRFDDLQRGILGEFPQRRRAQPCWHRPSATTLPERLIVSGLCHVRTELSDLHLDHVYSCLSRRSGATDFDHGGRFHRRRACRCQTGKTPHRAPALRRGSLRVRLRARSDHAQPLALRARPHYHRRAVACAQ